MRNNMEYYLAFIDEIGRTIEGKYLSPNIIAGDYCDAGDRGGFAADPG